MGMQSSGQRLILMGMQEIFRRVEVVQSLKRCAFGGNGIVVTAMRVSDQGHDPGRIAVSADAASVAVECRRCLQLT